MTSPSSSTEGSLREKIARIVADMAIREKPLTINEQAHVNAIADAILSALPIQPTLPGEIVEASEKATAGPWVMPYADDGDISAYADNGSWSADVEAIGHRLRRGDAAFIVAMENWVRALINAYRSEGKKG